MIAIVAYITHCDVFTQPERGIAVGDSAFLIEETTLLRTVLTLLSALKNKVSLRIFCQRLGTKQGAMIPALFQMAWETLKWDYRTRRDI